MRGNGIEVENLGKVRINGEWFAGFSYQGFLTVNTKTYVEEPERANDGSMPNIEDHDTFFVPRVKLNFKYLSIEDYQRLMRAVSPNQFPVEYWDKQTGDWVQHMMYCEPEEMAKLYNVKTWVFGVLDYEVSFIGTLNNNREFTISYDVNGGTLSTENNKGTFAQANVYQYGNFVAHDGVYYRAIYSETDSETGETTHPAFHDIPITNEKYWEVFSLLNATPFYWGRQFVVEDSNNIFIPPTGKTFKEWNTSASGKGARYYPNQHSNCFGNMLLYAIWG